MGIAKELLGLLKRKIEPARWHNLRSTKPVSHAFGFDRGTPIDRFYIEEFLKTNQSLIKGNVLEIAESTYSKKFGSNVTSFEVLHYAAKNNNATIIGDLTKTETLPENKIDCFICTQTLNFIYDFKAAIKGSFHLLKPGGVMLCTVAGLCQVSRYDMDRWGDYWRFTTKSIQQSFEEAFGNNVKVTAYGNVLSATALLQGITVEELTREELLFRDDDYQVVITIVATKPSNQ